MDTAKSDSYGAPMVDPAPPKNESTFAVGELIHPRDLEATFRVMSVGDNGMRICRISTKVIVPKSPFLVRFKGVLFKVVGWHKSNPRYFTVHTVKEVSIPE